MYATNLPCRFSTAQAAPLIGFTVAKKFPGTLKSTRAVQDIQKKQQGGLNGDTQ